MSAAVVSLILMVASTMKVPCRDIFMAAIDTYHRDRKVVVPAEERLLLGSFATSSCQTSNPDILWKMAVTESGLRPIVVRDNRSDLVFYGAGAKNIAAATVAAKTQPNLDVGILQINLKAHGQKMQSIGLSPFKPADQVTYIVDHMTPELSRRCGLDWVGCYHSWQSKKLAARYKAAVKKQDTALYKSLRGAIKNTKTR